MGSNDYLSEDGLAMVALCSSLALPEEAAADRPEPFKLSEWNQLEKQLQSSSLKRPSALQERSPEELCKEFPISPLDAQRVTELLGRTGQITLELETFSARGIWAVTRIDELYPAKLRDTLKHQAPTVLFGAGPIHLLGKSGVAVVGSRNIDEPGAEFARAIGAKISAAGLPVVSGGARGTDRLAMDGALQVGGKAVGALADSLEATIRKSDVRELVLDERLVLITAYAPTAGFSVGAAMGRNKMIYGLSEFAIVVSSDHQTGGTWAGAVEALRAGWCPVFVRSGAEVPKGNEELIKRGALPLRQEDLQSMDNLVEWAEGRLPVKSLERDLFG